MHVNGLTVQNFQGFVGQQSAECAPLTIIFGPNASGKSSISRALRLLKQSAETKFGSLEYVGGQINLKSRKYATFSQDSGLEVGAGLSFSLSPENPKHFGLKSIGIKKLSSEQSSRVVITATVAGLSGNDDYRYNFEVAFLPDTAISFSLSDPDLVERHFKEVAINESMVRALTLVDEHRDIYQDSDGTSWTGSWDDNAEEEWVSDSGHVVKELDYASMNRVGNVDLDTFRFAAEEGPWSSILDVDSGIAFSVDPSLELSWKITKDDFVFGAEERVDLLNSLAELALNSQKAYLNQLLLTSSVRPIPEEVSSDLADKPLDEVNKWLGELTDFRYSVIIDSEPAFDTLYTSITILDSLTNAEVNFENVGAGLSQILPILEALAQGSKALFVEQPELHLHPKMQADLADVFISSLESQDGPSQLFIETHSENMLLRVQRRIREGRIPSESVRIIYCEPEKDLIDLGMLVELGNSKDELLELVTRFSSEDPETVERKNYYLPLPESVLRNMSRTLGVELKLPEPRALGNRMVNLELDVAGDVLDPFPVSFADLRLTDLIG